MKFEDFKRAYEKIKTKGIEPYERTVSSKEYDILEKMARENKLTAMHYPKEKHWLEYCELMRKN